ncbi:MAG: MGMT family protein [Nitrososphaerales archaeon]
MKNPKSAETKIVAKNVYLLTLQIPKGKVSTYGLIAHALSCKGSSRAIGQILKRNPTPIVVPCHRVIKSDGSIGGYGGASGSNKKATLLRSEGVNVRAGVVQDLRSILFKEFKAGNQKLLRANRR